MDKPDPADINGKKIAPGQKMRPTLVVEVDAIDPQSKVVVVRHTNPDGTFFFKFVDAPTQWEIVSDVESAPAVEPPAGSARNPQRP